MPVENPTENSNENPTPKPKKRNERTEAKFLEDADKLIAEGERLGAEYMPPNPAAQIAPLKAKRDAVRAQRTVQQDKRADVDVVSNQVEILFKPLNSRVSSVVGYVESAGKPAQDVDLLRSTARLISGKRAGTVDPNGGSISVSHLFRATRADNFAVFIEQFDALDLKSTEDIFKVETLRGELAAMRQALSDLIAAEAAANTADEAFDKLAYTDADSLLNGCVSGKKYIKSKYKTTGEPYKNIAKTRFEMPSRLR